MLVKLRASGEEDAGREWAAGKRLKVMPGKSGCVIIMCGWTLLHGGREKQEHVTPNVHR